MRDNPDTHIPESRIIEIIAEDGRGRPAELEHLQQCGHCRSLTGDLRGDLDRFRQRAALAAPTPEQRFVLPADLPEPALGRRRRWGWATLGAGLSAALLALVIWVGEEKMPGLPPAPASMAAWEDPEMMEADRLVENALPKAYLALSKSLDGSYDEGFIDFLIPPLGEESRS